MKPVDEIQTLISKIAEKEVSFPQKIMGISEVEIARLECLSKRQFPGFYKHFLRHMGQSMGGFGIITYSFAIKDLVWFHENTDYFNWPSRYLLIAVNQQVPHWHYYIDLETLNLDGDGQIVSFEQDLDQDTMTSDDVTVKAGSLKELLTYTAFLGKILGAYPIQTTRLLTYKNLLPAERIGFFQQKSKN